VSPLSDGPSGLSPTRAAGGSCVGQGQSTLAGDIKLAAPRVQE
jgi:hypothetical protein